MRHHRLGRKDGPFFFLNYQNLWLVLLVQYHCISQASLEFGAPCLLMAEYSLSFHSCFYPQLSWQIEVRNHMMCIKGARSKLQEEPLVPLKEPSKACCEQKTMRGKSSFSHPFLPLSLFLSASPSSPSSSLLSPTFLFPPFSFPLLLVSSSLFLSPSFLLSQPLHLTDLHNCSGDTDS